MRNLRTYTPVECIIFNIPSYLIHVNCVQVFQSTARTGYRVYTAKYGAWSGPVHYDDWDAVQAYLTEHALLET